MELSGIFKNYLQAFLIVISSCLVGWNYSNS